jgi:ketosteroid isomerase-like protein
MKKLICYAVIASFATITLSFAGPDKAAVLGKETAAWQAYKDKKLADFQKVVDKDIRCVYADGVSNMAKEVADMGRWIINSFTINDFDMFTDEPDVVVTTYTVKIDGTLDGKDMSGTYNCGSVWKKEGNDWLAIFHTNIKAEAGAGGMTAPDGQKKE